MSVKATVVVPVYNPGPAIEPCIASLLGQSLPADQVEILFVDDGSTDGVPARLDQVAAEAPNVRVIHIPPSGAPGRPRNVGLAEAKGEYVHFVDADDILAPRALEWLTEVADRNQSDVVLGKYASANLDRSQVIFTHNRARASLERTPELLTASWAPTKLFRTSMLRERGITFPEGWRWMEDQVFLLRAYLAARNVSIFADEPCYFFVRRDDGGHLSHEAHDPEVLAEHLGVAFDVIEAGTEPGPFRERLLRRFYRANILQRLDEQYLEADAAFQERAFDAFHRFVTSRVDQSIDGPLTGVNRLRTRLLRTGDVAALLAFTQRLAALEVRAELTELRWRAGRLVVGVRAHLGHRLVDEPLRYVVRDGRVWLDPALAGQGDELIDAELETIMGRISLVEEQTALEWLVPGPFAPVVTQLGEATGGRATVSVVASVEIDPMRMGPAGVPLVDGTWSAILRWRGVGISRTSPIRARTSSSPPAVLPAAFGSPLRIVAPKVAENGLTLAVTGSAVGWEGFRAPATSVARQGRTLEVELPVVAGRAAGTAHAELTLHTPAGAVSWPAEIVPSIGRMSLRATGVGSGAEWTSPAEAPLQARLGPPFDATIDVGMARLDAAGGLRVIGAHDRGAIERARHRAWWHVRNRVARTRARLRQAAVDFAVRLPNPMRRVAVTAYRTVRSRRA